MTYIVCRDCGNSYEHDSVHRCPERRRREAEGFESRWVDSEGDPIEEGTPSWLEKVGPDETLRIRLNLAGQDLGIKVGVLCEWREGKLVRALVTEDPSLPERLRVQRRDLTKEEGDGGWERAAKELGLIP